MSSVRRGWDAAEKVAALVAADPAVVVREDPVKVVRPVAPVVEAPVAKVAAPAVVGRAKRGEDKVAPTVEVQVAAVLVDVARVDLKVVAKVVADKVADRMEAPVVPMVDRTDHHLLPIQIAW